MTVRRITGGTRASPRASHDRAIVMRLWPGDALTAPGTRGSKTLVEPAYRSRFAVRKTLNSIVRTTRRDFRSCQGFEEASNRLIRQEAPNSMNRSFAFVVSCLLLLIVTAGRADAQWARFRGPNGSGVDLSAGYPVEFSPTRNVAWKASVPYGQSSPVVVGTRLYGTASEAERLITFCLDTRTGRESWRRDVRRERAQGAYKANDPASPTPAADETGVVAFFPEFGLVSYNNDGQVRWTSRLGPFKNFYGMAGSPIIDGNMVVLVCDQQAGSFVIALDRSTGRQFDGRPLGQA